MSLTVYDVFWFPTDNVLYTIYYFLIFSAVHLYSQIQISKLIYRLYCIMCLLFS
jgi:hypothetical protein